MNLCGVVYLSVKVGRALSVSWQEVKTTMARQQQSRTHSQDPTRAVEQEKTEQEEEYEKAESKYSDRFLSPCQPSGMKEKKRKKKEEQ